MWTINLLSAFITVSVGLILLFNLRFFFILHPIRCAARLSKLMSERSLRRSLFLALAGTLGVGNIYGVSLGIMLGGAGSVFWLFVSSVFAMAVKYSECVLASEGSFCGSGMMVPIEKSFGALGAPVAKAYAIFMLVLSLSMGAFVQADSLITSATSFLSIDKMLVASAFLVLVIIVTSGGGEKIKNATEALIPIATVAYIALCIIVIMKDVSRFPEVISKVMSSAFSTRAFFGGSIPVISFSAFSQGFARGMLSNEAGAGTSAMAHTESKAEGADIGLFGIAEIFFDTNLLCMLTAFVILLKSEDPASSPSPMSLVFSSFREGAGEWSLIPLLISIIIFAYSTVICWYYYGVRCLGYLRIDRFILGYCFLFSLAILAPIFLDSLALVFVSDLFLFLMSIPTLICLALNRKVIAKKTFSSRL